MSDIGFNIQDSGFKIPDYQPAGLSPFSLDFAGCRGYHLKSVFI